MTGARTARRSVSAFGHRNYRLFFAGQAVSLVGTWMQQVAQAWLVLELTDGDPLWLGIVSVNGFLLIGWSTAYLIPAWTRYGPFHGDREF